MATFKQNANSLANSLVALSNRKDALFVASAEKAAALFPADTKAVVDGKASGALNKHISAYNKAVFAFGADKKPQKVRLAWDEAGFGKSTWSQYVMRSKQAVAALVASEHGSCNAAESKAVKAALAEKSLTKLAAVGAALLTKDASKVTDAAKSKGADKGKGKGKVDTLPGDVVDEAAELLRRMPKGCKLTAAYKAQLETYLRKLANR